MPNTPLRAVRIPDLYDQATAILRENHRVDIDGWNRWSCSCGKESGSSSMNHTRGIAERASQMHLRAEHRRVLAQLKAAHDG